MKKQNFISLLSRAKIFISLALVVVLVCSMSFGISAADATTGYATANATVFTPMDIVTGTNGITETEHLMLKEGYSNGMVWTFGVDNNVLENNEIVRPGGFYRNLDNYIKFSGADKLSSYAFYCSTANYSSVNYAYTVRTIKYIAASGEKMTFGFTVPVGLGGMYEISAPLSVETQEGVTVQYAVYKTKTDGTRVCLQRWEDYTSQTTAFCGLIAELNGNETVWLEAIADGDAVIDIGIPKVINHTDGSGIVNNGDGTNTYAYSIYDYFELTELNDIVYGGRTSPSNFKGTWEYGYFKDTVNYSDARDFTSTLGLNTYVNNLALDLTRNTELPTALIEAMKEYEIIIEDGERFGADENILTQVPTLSAASASVLYPSSSTSVKLTFRGSGEKATGTEYAQYGNWFKFTAPISGNAKLIYPETKFGNAVYMMVAVDNKIVYGTRSTTSAETTIDLSNISAGSTVTLIYYSISDEKPNATFALPSISITGTYNTLTLDANGGEDNYEKYVASGTAVTLPTPTKDSYSFLNWSDGTNTYNGGDTYKVSDNATLTANYQALSSTVDYDLDSDYDVDADDLVIMRQYLLGLGAIAEDRLLFADKNGKEGIDIRDLVHIRALIAVS